MILTSSPRGAIAAVGWCEALHTSPCTLETEAAAAVAAPGECPNGLGPNPCLSWTSPQFCVGFISGPGPVIPSPCPDLTHNFSSIQSAIASPLVTPGQTILVRGYTAGCDVGPCGPPVYIEELTIDKRVCLKADSPQFWIGSASEEWRYPVIIRSTSANPTVSITRAGSGSCIQGFQIDHRGSTESAAVVLGASDAQGVNSHVDSVTLVGNLIDVSNGTSPKSNGVNIHGKLNGLYRNVIRGRKIEQTAGVNLLWNAIDGSTCADWRDSQVNGNFITGFGSGIRFGLSGNFECGFSPHATGRIDRNDIADCNNGIETQAGALATPMRVAIMGNQISAGRPLAVAPGCDHDVSSIGLNLNDLIYSDVVGNRLSGVDMGVHLGYDACWTRVKDKQVVAGTDTLVPARAAWVCPSHCNWLIENELGTSDPGDPLSVAITFENRDFTCRGVKPHGSHVLDGGILRDAHCATKRRADATLTLGTLPARLLVTPAGLIDCP